MKLTFLGKDSTPNDSPTLYATDRDTYLVQGYLVTDPEALAQMRIPDGPATTCGASTPRPSCSPTCPAMA